MNDNYSSWRVSSHRAVTCNECHVPRSFVRKYLVKAENGFRHSWAFTFRNVQRFRITPGNLKKLEENCARCHRPLTERVMPDRTAPGPRCTACHRNTGHAL